MARARTTATHGPAWLTQAAVIARQFYLEGRSKVQIGADLGLSRFKVARILDEARELGLVEVRIRLPAQIDPELSSALRGRLGVHRAVVLAQSASAGTVYDDLGRVGADLLTELVTGDDVLGLTCSRSVTAAAQALRDLATCDVVQLTGTLAGLGADTGSVESVRTAAVVGGGRAFPIYAPMVLPDAATALSLAGQEAIRTTLDRIGSVTVAMVAIGGWREGLSTVWGSSIPRERAAAARAGAVGEIGGRLFDRHGAAVDGSIDRRVLGVSLAQLREIDEVVGLAYGSGRARAVSAAVAGGLVETLVCDADLARTLLDGLDELSDVGEAAAGGDADARRAID